MWLVSFIKRSIECIIIQIRGNKSFIRIYHIPLPTCALVYTEASKSDKMCSIVVLLLKVAVVFPDYLLVSFQLSRPKCQMCRFVSWCGHFIFSLYERYRKKTLAKSLDFSDFRV